MSSALRQRAAAKPMKVTKTNRMTTIVKTTVLTLLIARLQVPGHRRCPRCLCRLRRGFSLRCSSIAIHRTSATTGM